MKKTKKAPLPQVAISRETHDKLVKYCGVTMKLGAIADIAILAYLEQRG